jgi:hypothetical protein
MRAWGLTLGLGASTGAWSRGPPPACHWWRLLHRSSCCAVCRSTQPGACNRQSIFLVKRVVGSYGQLFRAPKVFSPVSRRFFFCLGATTTPTLPVPLVSIPSVFNGSPLPTLLSPHSPSPNHAASRLDVNYVPFFAFSPRPVNGSCLQDRRPGSGLSSIKAVNMHVSTSPAPRTPPRSTRHYFTQYSGSGQGIAMGTFPSIIISRSMPPTARPCATSRAVKTGK